MTAGFQLHRQLGMLVTLGALSLAGTADLFAQPAGVDAQKSTGDEFANISWDFEFDNASEFAGRKGYPMLVLLVELPASPASVQFGQEVLSHPLIHDAIESQFVHVAVFNGLDENAERTRKLLGERRFGDSVIHLITPDHKPLVKRLANNRTVAGLAGAMVTALEKSKRSVPLFLQLLAEETGARTCETRRATFQTHCFWEGESALGRVPGVLSTTPGFIQSKEVVEVEYDPGAISLEGLYSIAKSKDVATGIVARNESEAFIAGKLFGENVLLTDEATRPDAEPKYYLAKTLYRHVPMTSLQASRINAAIHRKEDPSAFLSRRQKGFLSAIERKPSGGWPVLVGEEDLFKAWAAASESMMRIFRKK